jgi:hypothetical protein
LEPDHRFIWFLCKTFKKLPDDNFFEEMDPIMKLYMYEHWVQDFKEKNEFARSYSILQGSFSNPEMAKKMINSDNNTYSMAETDEEFDKRAEELLNKELEKEVKDIKVKHKRRARRIVG